MPDEYTISGLTQSSGITNTDLMELATPDVSSETGYSSVSATVVQLASYMLKNILFSSDLNTTNKTIIGAINEVLAGGGASIMYGTTAPTAQQGSNGNLYVQYTAGTGGASDTVDALFVKLDGAWCEIETGGGAEPIETTITNQSIASFSDGADNVPVKELDVDITATESGSGTPSPSNPRAISGFSSGVVSVCGKNLVSDKIARSTILTDGSIASPDNNHDMFLAEIKQGVTYTIKSDENVSPSRQFVGAFFTSKPTIGSVSYSGTRLADVSATFTAPITGWVAFRASHDYAYAQCEVGNEQTTYEAYNGNTYTFAFGQTVYGGHFDNKGNLVVTHDIVDMGTLNWVYSSQNGWFQVVKPSDAKSVNDMDMLCSCYVNNGTSTSLDLSIFQTANNLRVKDSNYTDADVFKTAVNGQKIVYELATPITLAITSQDIPTILGNNNIFADTGDIEKVTYFNSNASETVELIDVKNPTKSVTWAEYQALSETDKNNGTIYLITDVNGDGQDFQPVIYSEEEREIGVWVDGKPLYEKTLILSSAVTLQSNTWTDVDNSDWSNIDTFAECCVINDHGASVGFVAVDKNSENNKLRVLSTRNTTITCKIIILRYTKTTDTAGSGTWTPQGVPAVHYSTDEHIVGTWIDGSTLYEKTIYNDNFYYPTTGTWVDIATISGISKLISSSAIISNSAKTAYQDFNYNPTNQKSSKIRADISTGKIQFISADNWGTSQTGADLIVIIRYIKSST